MRFSVLGSGSRGNATLVESGGTTLLIDAGFSAREIARRLTSIGRDPAAIDAILLTHEHRDHAGGAGTLSRALRRPLVANAATRSAAEHILGRPDAMHEFATGCPFTIGSLHIHPFSISHDCADPVGFVIEDESGVFGQLTDTGCLTRLACHHLRRCHALVLESNHDPGLLRDGPYPPSLKQRVQSNLGHLSNSEAATLLAQLREGPLSLVVLAHLSEVNNRPGLALEACQGALVGCGRMVPVTVAGQNDPSRVTEVRRQLGEPMGVIF